MLKLLSPWLWALATKCLHLLHWDLIVFVLCYTLSRPVVICDIIVEILQNQITDLPNLVNKTMYMYHVTAHCEYMLPSFPVCDSYLVKLDCVNTLCILHVTYPTCCIVPYDFLNTFHSCSVE